MNRKRRVLRRYSDAPDPGPRPDNLSLDGEPHSCGGTFRLINAPADVFIRGRTVVVDHESYRCDGCGEDLFDLWQIDEARAAAARKLNEEEGLLQPEEIKALRESLGLTQAAFEAALGIGEKTVVRWETGKVLPGQAMAMLLLLIQRDPSSLEFLASRRGGDVRIPPTRSAARLAAPSGMPRRGKGAAGKPA